jgi:hypothetical protein
MKLKMHILHCKKNEVILFERIIAAYCKLTFRVIPRRSRIQKTGVIKGMSK